MTLVNEETASAPGTRSGTADTSGAHTHGGPVVPEASRAARKTSFDVADFPVPGGREEEWKFSPLRDFAPLFEVVDPAPENSAAVEVSGPDVVEHTTGKPSEVGGKAFVPGDRAAAAGWNSTELAHLVRIPAEAELTEPVVVTIRGEAGRTTAGHVVVETGHHAKALVVLSHLGGGAHRGNVEVLAGDSSDLTVVTLQEWDADAIHVGQHDVRVGRDATVRHIGVSLGGKAVRVSVNVSYAAPGGDATTLGVYFAGSGQHSEHRQFIDHEATNCKSYVEYKGALQGESAHAVWIGDVLIRASAEGTETYELNRNLVLTDGARADSVPNLEIETGEIVGAGHASATGRFDDEQLFYLQSRGIPEEEARRLVVRGFFASIVEKIGIPEISQRLMTTIETQLSQGNPAVQNVEEN
ncbi:Fe-S cluster assembly protein SufD [Kineococcus sp. SYSU DK003]|uniref:Fe-S cluster assembly protein SufD n=1 Tax=Kineococcus sp. SYSU DK003 TaxID=3383124 RepID=UPI003D7D7EAA